LAYVSSTHAKIGAEIDIEIRAQKFPATVEKKPLYRKLTHDHPDDLLYTESHDG